MNVVDPIAGAPAANDRASGACLNCAAPLTGPYCAQCGQRAKVNRTLGSFLADFVSGMVNFEGRLWHTLPLLVWRPGDLTRRYVDGQRARFVSPVGLYLFTVFLMFAVLGFTGSLGNISFNNDLGRAIADQRAELGKLEQKRAAAERAGQDIRAMDRDIADRRAGIDKLENVQRGVIETDLASDRNNPAWLKEAVRKIAANPRAAANNVQNAASRYSWLLIPLSVPVMRLLFPLRRRRLYDHTVFVTYSLSFMMFLVIAGGLLVLAGASAWLPYLAFVPPVHLYRQLRGAYRLRWWDAALRTSILTVAAMIVLVLWAMAIMALGVLE